MRRLNLLAGMEVAEVEAISSQMRDRMCPHGQLILDPSAPGERIFLIKSGSVRIYRLSPDGRELTTAILRPGQLFGTSALVGGAESGAFAEVLEDAYVCDASAEEFARIMTRHPSLAAKVTVLMARQLLRLEQQLERLAFEDVPTRVAQALLVLAEDNGGRLPAKLTHEELAKLVGTTRESVTKVLAQFADAGAVELGYRRLAILDDRRLRQLGGLDEVGAYPQRR